MTAAALLSKEWSDKQVAARGPARGLIVLKAL
jgi:hypothetical protein